MNCTEHDKKEVIVAVQYEKKIGMSLFKAEVKMGLERLF